jgi:hypothetical protein
LIGLLIGYKMADPVYFTSDERATQKCKNEKEWFENVTIWSMKILIRYYFSDIHRRSFFSYSFVEN